MAKRPPELIYGLTDVPPLPVIVLLALQHMALIAIYLVVAVSVARMAGLDAEAGGRLVSLTMIAGGIGAVLQALGRFGIGSGTLVPTTTTTILLPAAEVALRHGGLPLFLGMSAFSGAVVVVLARLMPRLRPLFPPEIAGFVVFFVGLSVMVLADRQFLGFDVAVAQRPAYLAVSVLTLAVIVGISVWGWPRLRLFCTLIGIAAGYLLAIPFGQYEPARLAELASAPLFALPAVGSFGMAFDVALVPAFVISALAMALNSVGALTAAQRANDAEWQRPDVVNIGRGIVADGLTNVAAGVIGGVGQAATSGAVGLSLATGATCRVVGFGIGALLIGFSLSPALATALLVMPKPVIGAALLFSGCFLVVNGAQMMVSRLLDPRKVFMLGIALALGLARLSDPGYFQAVPDWIEPLVGSPMATAVTVAVLLNAVFRIGIHRRSRFTIDAARPEPARLWDFMTAQGQLWGAGPAVVYRACYAVQEVVETLAANGMVAGGGALPAEVRTRFDEFRFTVSVTYYGELLEPSALRPTEHDILEHPEGAALLARFMIGRVADRIAAEARDGRCVVTMEFDA
ncbi:solute carrier family 23 protein [Azospirillum sp.]|uniref:solute carrier family 23 protein n=1 Tax=Azospirillum sp. TaxID=34012 RepID=UPI002D69DD1B|nr:solute carrier family 23 protein [Azospirillum sp.]HYD69619.1 solute carrier family 23 protein [Azospirillum sp.]